MPDFYELPDSKIRSFLEDAKNDKIINSMESSSTNLLILISLCSIKNFIPAKLKNIK